MDRHRLKAAGLVPWALACGLAASCTWTPEVRPIQPSLVVEGPNYVIDHEEIRGKDYLLVVTDYTDRLDEGPEDLEGLSPTQLRDLLAGSERDILDVAAGESCRVPGFIFNYFYRRADAEATTVDGWRASYRRERDGVYTLDFVDEHCRKTGPTVETWSGPAAFRQVDSLATEGLVRDQSDTLWSLDPWEGKKKRVARKVLAWDFLATWPDDSLPDDETGLILLEGDRLEPGPDGEVPVSVGELVIRRLSGEEVARFAEGVAPGFEQTNYGGLRVAWARDGVIYEAVAPDLTPVRLTPLDGDACNPRYSSGKLEFFFPCDRARLNRLDLATGELEQLEDGVVDESQQRGWNLERRYVGDPDPETGARPTAVWAQAPGEEEFVRVDPDLGSIRAIDASRLLGISQKSEGYGDLGTWHISKGFETILESVSFFYTFEDNRYTADRDEPVYLWVVHHGIRNGIGDISLLSSRDLSIESIAEGVPEGGFRQYNFAAVVNPTLVILRDLGPVGGVLDVRLIPELLGTRVDEGVIGFTSRSSYQEPGLYYSVGPGEREGIWFAPL